MSIFSCASWPSVCLLWRNVYLGLPPIFLICCCCCYWVSWAICMFWRSVACQLFCLQVFSYILKVFFLSHLWFPFLHKRLLSLICFHWFIFVFIFIILGGGSEKILLWFMSKSVPIFSYKSFTMSSLTFRSLIYI